MAGYDESNMSEAARRAYEYARRAFESAPSTPAHAWRGTLEARERQKQVRSQDQPPREHGQRQENAEQAAEAESPQADEGSSQAETKSPQAEEESPQADEGSSQAETKSLQAEEESPQAEAASLSARSAEGPDLKAAAGASDSLPDKKPAAKTVVDATALQVPHATLRERIAAARAENEDDDGYDPWSDRREEPELFERDPWR